MNITQLIKKNNKMIIVFDSGEEIRVHYDLFIKNGLRRGDDLSDASIELLKKQSDALYIKETALRLLGRRQHSIKELKRKLVQKKYDDQMINPIIEDLCESGYLNDAAFAKMYMQEKITRKDGIQKIRNELYTKGISKEIINEVLADIDTGQEKDNAIRIAEKKAGQLKARGIEGKELKQKVYAFLISKGYEFELIREVLDHSNIED